MERLFLAIMDIRARSISFVTRPRRPEEPPDHERAGETFFSISSFLLADLGGKPVFYFIHFGGAWMGLGEAIPPEPPSFACPRREGERRWRTRGGSHPLGEQERAHVTDLLSRELRSCGRRPGQSRQFGLIYWLEP